MGSRVGGAVLKSRPVVSMKNGAALSVVLALGGTAMFWVMQGACASAADMSDTADIIVPARTANMLRMVFSPGTASLNWPVFAGNMTRGWEAVKFGAANRCRPGEGRDP